jgi:5-methyltetrahydropteroyltriglutamate--homocysteine methyltransferase
MDGRPPASITSAACCVRRPCVRRSGRYARQEIGDAVFGRVQDRCIEQVVREQEDVGLAVVTDGEFRRGSYWDGDFRPSGAHAVSAHVVNVVGSAG